MGKINIEQFILEHQNAWMKAGSLFRQERMKLNLTQRDVAKQIGVSKSVISRLENGRTIRRRRLVEGACATALETFRLRKLLELQNMNADSCLSCDLRQ